MEILRRRKSQQKSAERRPLLQELERLLKRALVVPLAAPVLLLVGFSVGEVTTESLALPAEVPVRAGPHVPRIQLESLGRFMETIRRSGAATVSYVTMYQEHVAPVEASLLKRGIPEATARRVAWPLVEQSYLRDLDPATVLAVLLIESRGDPDATSFVGARGLMQVMPMNQGEWRGCGYDLYDIENNLCYGTSILAWFLQRYDYDERRALLGYNGCINGTNTPNCWTYPTKVARERRQLLEEWGRRVPGAGG
ncbi:MAG: transglycosylase SLT domain-containing protein, partial [Longimicrobiales bacterium]